MADVRAVIFDLDGCLVDSEPLALDAIAAEMRALGIDDAEPEEIRDRFLGVSIGVICDHVAMRSGAACPPDFPRRFEDRVLDLYQTRLRLIDGALPLLETLKGRGLSVAIATGGSIRRMTRTLQLSGLAPHFEGRSFSADQVARGKPAPDLVLHAAQALGAAPAGCVVFEDSPHGVRGAIAAGMRAIGFVGGSHLDEIRDAHADRLREAGAERVVTRLSDLPDAIGNPPAATA
ncbi:HAD family hydrolase [Paracoccus spongiarum]|uniref:HAD family phosphatase n=1 Tax=Paracoccus spongiarum TaxID=3064387 RepID=A0ABT9JEX1_9RHOB|nr:HAD family phosphatase [Paracoccus sp. 2205BS29-5]MDP5308365.1 HAD family phosphatase [Paracoccus sp. 2205BS29-5]